MALSTRELPPSRLPIEEVVPALRASLATHSAVVLEAPPGTGKTTLVPLRLIDEPWLAGKRILMLQPRRLATRAAAARMAALLAETPGGTIGYAMRFERRIGPETRIEVVTEGLLTRRLQRDPALEGYGLVVFDEFHERSLDADLGLALCLEVQGALRPDLRLLVMSATLDGAAVAGLMGDAPLLRSAGRAYPVEVEHLPAGPNEPLENLVGHAVERALAATSGDVLVFLPGAREIERTRTHLTSRARLAACAVHVLHGELPRNLQERALALPAPGVRKVVLATNIAETSLTIEGMTAVVDAGLERRPRFSPRTGMSRLVTLPIAKASAEQRKGRAGRLGPGLCLRLWPIEEDRGRPEHRPAEIEEADLAPLALELAAWGVREPGALRFPTAPPAGALRQATALLQQLEALDPKGSITPHGRAMAELPLHPRLAHMALRAKERGLAPTALAVAALLSGRDPASGRNDADLASRVARLAGGDDALRDARRVRAQLARALREPVGTPDSDATGEVVSLAYPDRLARARPGAPGAYRLTNGKGARLDPADPLAREAWLAVASIDDGSESRIRLAASLRPASLEALHGFRFTTEDRVVFDPRQQGIVASRVLRLGALTIKEQPLPAPEPERVLAAWCHVVRARGAEILPWGESARRLQARVEFLRRRDPQAWPAFDDPALLADLEGWLGTELMGLRRLDELKRADLAGALRRRLDGWQRHELDRRAPVAITVPTGRQVAVDYGVDPPVLAVKLQELFGLATTPAVDEGRVALSLQLLSPAQRPIAVTRDLAGFWAGGYAAVRKELRGRYPKHPWPEDPLASLPTRGVRARP